jgi:hypothetical protein
MSQSYLQLATLLHFISQPPPLGRVVPDASWLRFTDIPNGLDAVFPGAKPTLEALSDKETQGRDAGR